MRRLPTALALLLAGCASTTSIVSRWKAPDAAPLDPTTPVMVMVLARSPDVRRRAEAELARLIPGATPSASLFGDAQLRDVAHVRRELEARGHAAFIVMRFVGVGTARWSGVRAKDPRTPVWELYERLWEHEQAPAHPYIEVETRLFRVSDGALAWVAVSDTRDATRVEGLIDEVATACRNQLLADGLLAAPR